MIPEGYTPITPYLIVNDGAAAIDFYQRAFGAKERMRMADSSGRIGHAELEIYGGVVMLADECPDMDFRSARTIGASPVFLHVYVEDVDAAFQQALDAGATVTQSLSDRFYGDRSGSLVDPFGHHWSLSTRIRTVSPEEIQQALAAMSQSGTP